MQGYLVIDIFLATKIKEVVWTIHHINDYLVILTFLPQSLVTPNSH